jgi:hypothetical protein
VVCHFAVVKVRDFKSVQFQLQRQLKQSSVSHHFHFSHWYFIKTKQNFALSNTNTPPPHAAQTCYGGWRFMVVRALYLVACAPPETGFPSMWKDKKQCV